MSAKPAKKFWVIARVTEGRFSLQTSDRYQGFEYAENAAQTYARQYEDSEFVILEAMYGCKKSDVSWTHYTDETQEMPF